MSEATYLWDRTGEADAEVARLESLLAAYRWAERPLAIRAEPRRMRWPVLAFAGAAALLLAATGLLIVLHSNPRLWQPTRGWKVEARAGAPQVEARAIQGTAVMPVGSVLSTDHVSSAELKLGHIGSVVVRPDSALRLVRSSGGKYRVALLHGSISARTWAPPSTFAVQTAGAMVIDLGCTFDMDVDEAGRGTVRVSSGWVEVEQDFRESLIPAGAAAQMRPDAAPGTPYFLDSAPQFQAALQQLDFGPRDPAWRAAALDTLLPAARARDVYSLLRLAQDSVPAERERIVDRAAQLAPLPPGVTREGILSGDRRMMDSWYNGLGLTNVKRWWVHWQDAF